MKNFKTCINGHNYDADKYTVCPYCPVNENQPDYDKTLDDFRKTRGFDEMNSSQFDVTMVNEDVQDMKSTPPSKAEHPFKRTTVVGDGVSQPAGEEFSQKRKLVGWLVTFSHDEYGEDYKLYVGKNKIGSAPDCDIVINDPSVSGDHATILFRDNEFLIRDNFSTNGTRINGKSIKEGNLNEGDELKLGNTILKFKTVF